MSDLRTRRLIVTLPDVSGEEADSAAQWIEDELTEGFSVAGTVTHALGESLPNGWTCRITDMIRENGRLIHVDVPSWIDALEARQLAGVLLAHAETMEATTGQES